MNILNTPSYYRKSISCDEWLRVADETIDLAKLVTKYGDADATMLVYWRKNAGKYFFRQWDKEDPVISINKQVDCLLRQRVILVGTKEDPIACIDKQIEYLQQQRALLIEHPKH